MNTEKLQPASGDAEEPPYYDPPGPSFWQNPAIRSIAEAAVLLFFSFYLLGFGLAPVFGGDILGLVGADEPRYAQIAREMLQRMDHDCSPIKQQHLPWVARRAELFSCDVSHSITPILYGKPWLEKPALYYWRAMLAFKEFGISDWAARIPSVSFAVTLVLLIYLHMRRFRPGGHLDAAMITASCVGIVAFARGASTDMQLAAPFCIGMLGWYAWYETGSKFWLFDLYFFGAAATLAKGPVAPAMAFIIIFLFAALRKEWSLLRRTIWLPGVVLYLIIVLPWFIAVQHRNPAFLRVFFLEHNLQRFATNRYQHAEPFYYYILILLLALLPWTVIALAAMWDSIKMAFDEWRVRHKPSRYLGTQRPGDAFPEFLVLWSIFPILFFSLSKSKLPGYILPSIPPITILTGDYLNRIRYRGLKPALLVLHALLAAVMTVVALLLPYRIVHGEGWPPGRILLAAFAVGLGATVLILVVVARFGLRRLRAATLVPVVLVLFSLLGDNTMLGRMIHLQNGKLLDYTYSARPMARILARLPDSGKILAVYKVRRDMEFGLSFYRDHPVSNYLADGVPDQEHLVVVRDEAAAELKDVLKGRSYEPIFLYPAQELTVYRVTAK